MATSVFFAIKRNLLIAEGFSIIFQCISIHLSEFVTVNVFGMSVSIAMIDNVKISLLVKLIEILPRLERGG